MVHCCTVRRNRETAIADMKSRWRYRSIKPLLNQSGVGGHQKSVRKWGHLAKGRRLRLWEMLRGIDYATKEWGVDERIGWIELTLSNIVSLRCLLKMTVDYTLCIAREGKTALYKGEQQMEGGEILRMEMVGV